MYIVQYNLHTTVKLLYNEYRNNAWNDLHKFYVWIDYRKGYAWLIKQNL
jgi:hypothetical protein